MVELSVCIVAYGQTADDHVRLTESLGRAIDLWGGSAEVLVGDCSVEAVRVEEAARENLGHSEGSNRLARWARGDVLLFLNPDVHVAPSSLRELFGGMEKGGFDAVDARQIPLEHPKWFSPRTGRTSWTSGACLLVDRRAFEEVGGFDAEFFWSYVNDVDISWRIRSRGGTLGHVASSVIFHDKRLSSEAQLTASAHETEFGTLGRLNLASRFGRPDIVRETVAWVRAHGSPAHHLGVDRFESQVAQGRLPAPIDFDEVRREFIAGNYGRMRF